ncbi:hypothetical protein OQA88_5827 [Cercophora sp. LCS_1]
MPSLAPNVAAQPATQATSTPEHTNRSHPKPFWADLMPSLASQPPTSPAYKLTDAIFKEAIEAAQGPKKAHMGFEFRSWAERIIMATPTTRVAQDNLATIKAWFRNPTREQPAGACPSCWCELDIKGLLPLPSQDDIEGHVIVNGRRTPAMAYWCGHLTCVNCANATIEELAHDKEKDIYDFQCPVCRTPSIASGCGHPVLGIMVPTEFEKTGETVTSTKATIQEGGHVPRLCQECGREEWWVKYCNEEDDE